MKFFIGVCILFALLIGCTATRQMTLSTPDGVSATMVETASLPIIYPDATLSCTDVKYADGTTSRTITVKTSTESTTARWSATTAIAIGLATVLVGTGL
jgi:hypothetical protein